MKRTGHAGKTDGNQDAIIDALRSFGCSVRSAAALGDGFPDLVCAVNGNNFLIEVKDPAQPVSKRRLTPMQKDFHREWRGRVHLVETIEQAIIIAAHYCKGD